MPSYSFSFYQYNDLTAISGSPLTTTSTTGTTGSFSVNGGASPISITVNDDDDIFHDAYIDTGTSQTLATAVTVNGTNYAAGSVVELEFKVSTTTGETFAYIRIGGVNVGIGGAYGTFPQVGSTYTIASSSDGQQENFDDMACFAGGTLIDTAAGPKRIEDLTLESRILTQTSGAQCPLWIGRRFIDVEELRQRPEWAPIRIGAGALGNRSEVVVSPQHRVLISDWRAQFYFGEDQILVPAAALVDGDAIRIAPVDRPVVYFHLLFARHQVVFSDGFASESYYPDGKPESDLAAAAKAEVLELFPEVAAAWSRHGYGKIAHPVARPKVARGISWSDAA